MSHFCSTVLAFPDISAVEMSFLHFWSCTLHSDSFCGVIFALLRAVNGPPWREDGIETGLWGMRCVGKTAVLTLTQENKKHVFQGSTTRLWLSAVRNKDCLILLGIGFRLMNGPTHTPRSTPIVFLKHLVIV